MKSIVFLGSKELGISCLRILYDQAAELNYNIVGVLTNERGDEIKEFSKSKKIPILRSLDEYCKLKSVDIAISVQYHEILKRQHIDKAKELTVNLHMAPLPEYRGCNQFSFAIVDNAKEFGTTIHLIDENIDSGDILFEDRFPIATDCWIDDLYDVTYSRSVALFSSSLKDIVLGNINPKKQSSFKGRRNSSLHYRREIEDIKKINLSWDKRENRKAHKGHLYIKVFSSIYDRRGADRLLSKKGLMIT